MSHYNQDLKVGAALQAQRRKSAIRILEASNLPWDVVIALGFGLFSAIYSLSAPNAVAQALDYVYWKGKKEDGFAITATSICGMMVGNVLFGWLADRRGRRRMYLLQLQALLVSTVGIAMSSSGQENSMSILGWLVWWRLVQSIAIGGIYVMTATMLVEYAPSVKRMRMATIVMCADYAARVAVDLTALEAAAHMLKYSSTSIAKLDSLWRVVQGIGAIFPVVTYLLISTYRIKESARWKVHLDMPGFEFSDPFRKKSSQPDASLSVMSPVTPERPTFGSFPVSTRDIRPLTPIPQEDEDGEEQQVGADEDELHLGPFELEATDNMLRKKPSIKVIIPQHPDSSTYPRPMFFQEARNNFNTEIESETLFNNPYAEDLPPLSTRPDIRPLDSVATPDQARNRYSRAKKLSAIFRNTQVFDPKETFRFLQNASKHTSAQFNEGPQPDHPFRSEHGSIHPDLSFMYGSGGSTSTRQRGNKMNNMSNMQSDFYEQTTPISATSDSTLLNSPFNAALNSSFPDEGAEPSIRQYFWNEGNWRHLFITSAVAFALGLASNALGGGGGGDGGSPRILASLFNITYTREQSIFKILEWDAIHRLLALTIPTLVAGIAWIALVRFFRSRDLLVLSLTTIGMSCSILGILILIFSQNHPSFALKIFAIIQLLISISPTTLLATFIPPTLFPTHIRATCTGLALSFTRIGMLLGHFLHPLPLFSAAPIIPLLPSSSSSSEEPEYPSLSLAYARPTIPFLSPRSGPITNAEPITTSNARQMGIVLLLNSAVWIVTAVGVRCWVPVLEKKGGEARCVEELGRGRAEGRWSGRAGSVAVTGGGGGRGDREKRFEDVALGR